MENTNYVDNKIAKYQTGKGLIEALDTLSFNKKIKINALDYSKGTGENTITAFANIDYEIMFSLANKIINGIEFGKPSKINPEEKYLLYEYKILSHKADDKGIAPVTIISIIRNSPKMRLKYKVIIENGTGKAQKTSTGGIACAKGSYKSTSKVQIMVSEEDFDKFMAKIYLKIMAWSVKQELQKK